MKFIHFKIFGLMAIFCLVVLLGTPKSFAQTDSSADENNASDEQAREVQTQETLNQIHDLESKMEANAKRLDALERAVDQQDAAMPPVETADKIETTQQAPVQAVMGQKASVPAPQVQLASNENSPEEHSIAQLKEEPADVVPQAPIYYSPLTQLSKEHTFELSQEDFYSNFKETGNSSANAGLRSLIIDHKSTGEYFGLKAGYTFRPLDTENWLVNVLHVDVHGDYGIQDFKDNQGDDLRNINSYIVEPKAWIGKDLNFGSNSLTPYLGVGFRWNFEDLKNKIDTQDPYDAGIVAKSNNTQSEYVYVPVGAQLSLRPADGWRIDSDGEFDYLAWGRVTENSIEFTDGLSSIDTSRLNYTLRSGYGLQGSIKIIKEGNTFNYFIEPFIRYWYAKPSKTTYLSIEGSADTEDPIQQDKSSSTEIGGRVGVEF